jgi:hypothetical protein
MNFLGDKDLNNLHLTCKKFNEIANNHPHTLFVDSGLNIELLKNSSRIHRDVKIKQELNVAFNHHGFKEAFKEIGIHVENLELEGVFSTTVFILDLLVLFPNLLAFQVNCIDFEETHQNFFSQEALLPKLKSLQVIVRKNYPFKIVNNLICVNLRELVFKSTGNFRNLLPFLKRHENSLRVLKLESNFHFPRLSDFSKKFSNLKGLRLESLNLSLGDYSDSDFNLICEMGTIQKLSLNILGNHFGENGFSQRSIDDLQKLKKLKALALTGMYCSDLNPLNGLIATINENLTDLQGPLTEASSEFIQQLSISLPNLEKLQTTCKFQSPNIWRHFKKLKHLDVRYYSNELRFSSDLDAENVMGNLKYLKLQYGHLRLDQTTVSVLAHDFPNLEKLHLSLCRSISDSTFTQLLKGLKNLKSLVIDDSSPYMASVFLEYYVKKYGPNLNYFRMDKCDEHGVYKECSIEMKLIAVDDWKVLIKNPPRESLMYSYYADCFAYNCRENIPKKIILPL